MNDLKVLVTNVSNAESIISDIFTFGCLIGCFFVNYNFLGNSTVITILISACFFVEILVRSSKKVKRMSPDEAIEYLLERRNHER